ALWQVMARVIDQGSRLSAVRLAMAHAACDVLGLGTFDEDALYENLDWLAGAQALVEAAPEKFESERFCSDKRINRQCALVNFCSSFFLETPRCGLSNSTFLMRPSPP